MKSESLFEAIGFANDELLARSEHYDCPATAERKVPKTMLIMAAVIAALVITAAAVSSIGVDIIDWIASAFSQTSSDNATDSNYIKSQLDEGQWAYLSGNNIAVIVPESPVKILLSSDSGKTWKQSKVSGSDKMEAFGDLHEDIQYKGGYIGFYSKTGGYLILTADVAMNNQPMRIYLTSDGGETWVEIGNPYKAHASVITGASFASKTTGFISYRYYEDAGPDIWWTSDGGASWSKLVVNLPAEYQFEQFRFTPRTPAFKGQEGIYPISVLNSDTGAETTVDMYSQDGGLTWSFDR